MKGGMNTMSSFTVENDLLSQTSMSSMHMGGRFGQFKPIKVSQKRVQELQNKAKREIFRQENEKLFNPFEHRLAKGFGRSQQDIFLRQKERIQEQLRKKQQNQINQCRNYTIVFNDRKVQNKHDNVFKAVANNVLSRTPIKQQDQDQLIYHPQNTINNTPIIPRTVPKSTPKYSRSSLQPASRLVPPKSPNNITVQKSYTPKQRQNNRSTIQPPKSTQVNKTNQNNNNRNSNKNMKPPLKPNNKQSKGGTNPKFSDTYEGPDINLVLQLEKQIIQTPNIQFSSIAQLETAKQLLREAVLLPKLMPQFFTGIRKATKGILLFGPPGTGKTMLAKAIAKDNIFFNVSASSLASKWRGQSQKLVRILFEMARFYAPSVIFFDQIDALGAKRSQDQGQANRKVKTQLLVQMDGVNSDPKKHVFVLAATNRPWDLDQALRRRLQKRIYIPLPSQKGRQQMFKINLQTIKVDQKVSYKQLSKLTKDYSGADIAIVCREAAYMPMRRKLASLGGFGNIEQISKLTQQIDIPITQDDLLAAIKNTNKSVGNNDLKRYQSWMKQFGSS